jgi:hypothetical protein
MPNSVVNWASAPGGGGSSGRRVGVSEGVGVVVIGVGVSDPGDGVGVDTLDTAQLLIVKAKTPSQMKRWMERTMHLPSSVRYSLDGVNASNLTCDGWGRE